MSQGGLEMEEVLEKSASCHKVDRIIDVQVHADVTGLIWGRPDPDPDRRAADLEKACREFHDFIKDHRSMDGIRLSVEKVHGAVCSECEHEWETVEEDGEYYCAWCGGMDSGEYKKEQ